MASFLASLVECVEALTVVLAVGSVRGWRSALVGSAAAVGITAGFITLVANAAGPLMAIYLVAMRLPKMQFVGTAAVFFMVLNLFKVPFMVELGLITVQSFAFNLALAPAVLLGAFAGRWLLMRINQRLFEKLVLALSAIAGVLLIV